jgi:hypothetical protein
LLQLPTVARHYLKHAGRQLSGAALTLIALTSSPGQQFVVHKVEYGNLRILTAIAHIIFAAF